MILMSAALTLTIVAGPGRWLSATALAGVLCFVLSRPSPPKAEPDEGP